MGCHGCVSSRVVSIEDWYFMALVFCSIKGALSVAALPYLSSASLDFRPHVCVHNPNRPNSQGSIGRMISSFSHPGGGSSVDTAPWIAMTQKETDLVHARCLRFSECVDTILSNAHTSMCVEYPLFRHQRRSVHVHHSGESPQGKRFTVSVLPIRAHFVTSKY